MTQGVDSDKALLAKAVEQEDGEAAFQFGNLLREIALSRRGTYDYGPFEHVQEWDRAAVAYRTALQLGYGPASCNLGEFLEWHMDARDEEGAEAAYRRGIELGYGPAAMRLGDMLSNHGDPGGDFAAAERAYMQAVELGEPHAGDMLGAMREKLGDLDGAKAAYFEAVERGDVWAAESMGDLLRAQGDLDGAADAYRKSIMLEPPAAGDTGKQRRRGFLYNSLGAVLEQAGDLTGAKEAYHKAAELGYPGAAYTPTPDR